jgi:hypothetical protein
MISKTDEKNPLTSWLSEVSYCLLKTFTKIGHWIPDIKRVSAESYLKINVMWIGEWRKEEKRLRLRHVSQFRLILTEPCYIRFKS